MAKILVVDDSQAIRAMIEFTLKEQGHEVIAVHDAESALEILTNPSIDLVLTDINMDGMSGYQLTEAIRQLPDYQHTPIIALTTESDKKAQITGKQSGMTGWLAKPFQPEKLTQIVRHFTS